MTQPNPTDDVERAILAALLLDSSRLSDLDGQLVPEDFTEGARRSVYQAMLNLHRAGDPIDLITVGEEVSRLLPGVPVAGALAKLTSHPGSPSHLIYYAEQLRATRTIQNLQVALAEGIEDLRTCAAQPDAVSSLVTDISLRVEAHAVRVERTLEFDLGAELSKAFDDMRKTDEPPGISTGFLGFDDLIHGLRPGKFIVIAGRPGMGKSAFGLNVARHLAQKRKHTLFFSMEMLRGELVQRLISAESDVNLSRIISRTLNEDELIDIGTAIGRIRDLPLTICDEPNVGPAYIRSALRREMKKGPVDCIMVDYLQIMSSNAKAEARHLEIGLYSRELKRVAQEFEIPVIAMAQLSRNVEARDKGMKPCYPRLSDLRESGAIEQDADVVAFLYRGHYYDAEGWTETQCELNVAKNRGGCCGTVNLFWRGDRTRFENAAASETTLIDIPAETRALPAAKQRNFLGA